MVSQAVSHPARAATTSTVTPDKIIKYNNITPSLSLMVPRNPEVVGVKGEKGRSVGQAVLLAETRKIWEDAIRPRFEEFWESYPRKESRHDAWLEWMRIFEQGDVEYEDIMRGLWHAMGSRQWNQSETRFVPNPARWLRERRWTDQMERVPEDEYLPF